MYRMLEEIDKAEMSYLEANEAMYRMDTMLRERSFEVPIAIRQKP